MSTATPTGVLVCGASPARRAEVAGRLRADGTYTPVRIASQLAEAVKCLADGAVHRVVVLDDAIIADQLQRYVTQANAPIIVYGVHTEAELQSVLHTMRTPTGRVIDRP